MQETAKWKKPWKLVSWTVLLASEIINSGVSKLWTIGRARYIQAVLLLLKTLGPVNIQVCNQSTSSPESSSANPPQPSKIRLFRIRPGFFGNPIECDLLDHNLGSCTRHPYTAISYTWGNLSPKHRVTVHAREKEAVDPEVTSSALEVLKAMRSHTKPVTIWIDAICIIQNSDEDKAEQIPLMPKIYEGARKTVIWLGHSPSAALAVGTINRIFLLNRLERFMGTKTGYEMSRPATEALQEILEHKWYGRVWIVQEVVRSKRSIIVRYGEESLTWEKFSWFSQAILGDDSWLDMLSNRTGPRGLNLKALRNIQVIKRFSLLVSEDQPLSILFYLAQMFRSPTIFDATVTKDRIYALLGLSGLATSKSFIPEYKTPVRELYVKLAKYLGEKSSTVGSSLDFLMYAGTGYGSLDADLRGRKPDPTKQPEPPLPSWVPNWSLETKALPLIGTGGTEELLQSSSINKVLQDAALLASFSKTNRGLRGATHEEKALKRAMKVKSQIQESFFFAASGTSSDCSFHDEILMLRGNRVDRVRWIGQEFPDPGTEESKTLSILGMCKEGPRSLSRIRDVPRSTILPSERCIHIHSLRQLLHPRA